MLKSALYHYANTPWIGRRSFERIIDDLTEEIMAADAAAGILPPWPLQPRER